jgi:hypothetical protein
MRLPRMTTRRWMFSVAVVAIDCVALTHKSPDPLAVLATFTTVATILLVPALILLCVVASGD